MTEETTPPGVELARQRRIVELRRYEHEIEGATDSTTPQDGEAISPFEKILIGTIKLHLLGLVGRNDSDEADAIRDEMDKPWLELTEPQRQAAHATSAALNNFLDRLIAEPLSLAEDEREAIRLGQRLIREAYASGRLVDRGVCMDAEYWYRGATVLDGLLARTSR